MDGDRVVHLGTLAAQAQQQAAPPQGAVYTEEQAERGRRVYGAYCATCHGTELEGAVGPALGGPAFLRKWGATGRDAAGLYHLIRTTMPKPASGSLSPEAYADVFGYMLKRNGLPAGTTSFTGTTAQLGAVHLDQLAASGGPGAAPAPAFIPGEKGLAPTGKGPTQAQLTAASDPADWLYHTGSYAGQRAWRPSGRRA